MPAPPLNRGRHVVRLSLLLALPRWRGVALVVAAAAVSLLSAPRGALAVTLLLDPARAAAADSARLARLLADLRSADSTVCDLAAQQIGNGRDGEWWGRAPTASATTIRSYARRGRCASAI